MASDLKPLTQRKMRRPQGGVGRRLRYGIQH